MYLGIQLPRAAYFCSSLFQLEASSEPQNTENDLSDYFLISPKGVITNTNLDAEERNEWMI